MNSHAEIFGMITTEAIESEFNSRGSSCPNVPTSSDANVPTLKYSLRLVREPDGTLKWED
jgi:hypothetical protein